jgi:hypothetical protein
MSAGGDSTLFCTSFDSAYLARGLVMLRSLWRHAPDARVLVLALDERCERVLADEFAGRLEVVTPALLTAAHPALSRARDGRSRWALYATLKPAAVLFALDSTPQPRSVLFIDADTWFFHSPAPIFEEIGAASIALSPHRFHAATRHLEIFGLYNAGCIHWRNDDTARRAVVAWRDACLDCCSEAPQSDGRFMNQGYLNLWPARYPGVHTIRHPGCNLAPWNIDGHRLAHDATLTVDGFPLIFFHFHGLARERDGRWCSHFPHLSHQPELGRRAIYLPYITAVETERTRLVKTYGIDGASSVRPPSAWPPCLRFHPDWDFHPAIPPPSNVGLASGGS